MDDEGSHPPEGDSNAPSHRLVRSCQFEPFLLYCAMRGMEQAMMDLIVEPEIAEAALGHIFDYHYALNERTFEIGGGRIDVTYVAEDLGGQTALLFCVDQIRRFILPNQNKVAEYVLDSAAGARFSEKLEDLMEFLLPQFEREGKSYLTMAFGCTGGRHRSVVFTNPIGTF